MGVQWFTTVTPVSSEHSEPSVSETWWSERKKRKENAESDFETTLNQADKWEWPFLSDCMISDWRSLSLGCSAASLGLCRRQGKAKERPATATVSTFDLSSIFGLTIDARVRRRRSLQGDFNQLEAPINLPHNREHSRKRAVFTHTEKNLYIIFTSIISWSKKLSQ